MNDNEQLDEVLDEALSEYRHAEPLAGLEDRVLHRLRSQPQDSRSEWWKWGAVAAGAALVLVALWIGGGRSRVSRPPVNQVAKQQQEAQNPSAPGSAKSNANQRQQEIASRHTATAGSTARAARRDTFAHVARVDAASTSEPKAMQFPLPVPLTAEEHALLALARTHPETLLNWPEQDRKLIITPIDIKLLPEPNGDSEGDN